MFHSTFKKRSHLLGALLGSDLRQIIVEVYLIFRQVVKEGIQGFGRTFELLVLGCSFL